MDYVIEWDGDGPEDIRVETSGPVDVDALDAIVEEALADPRYRPNMQILVDHTRASWGAVGGDEIRRRASLVLEKMDRIGPQRVAFVVSGRVDLGIARLLAAYTSSADALDVKLFPTVPAAREWLTARR